MINEYFLIIVHYSLFIIHYSLFIELLRARRFGA